MYLTLKHTKRHTNLYKPMYTTKLKNGPERFFPPGIHDVVQSSIHWLMACLRDQVNTVELIVMTSKGRSKNTVVFTLPFLGLFSLGELSCHVMRILRKPMQRVIWWRTEASSDSQHQLTIRVNVSFWNQILLLSETFGWRQPWQHLDWNFLREPGPEPPS